jgi:hypothetical protein
LDAERQGESDLVLEAGKVVVPILQLVDGLAPLAGVIGRRKILPWDAHQNVDVPLGQGTRNRRGANVVNLHLSQEVLDACGRRGNDAIGLPAEFVNGKES